MDEQPAQAERLERYRPYLALLARLGRGRRLCGNVDASDVVQQTLLAAVRDLAQFRGTTDGELAAWLRRILARQLAHADRDLHRDKRDARRERSLEAELDRSSACLAAWLAAEEPSPPERVCGDEDAVRLAAALERLPQAQREAIELHYWAGCTVAETGAQLGRTTAAVAGLLQRGLRALRGLMKNQE